MNTIKQDKIEETIIKKSKFISYVFYITSNQEAEEKIKKIKEKYKDATHCCYAYIVDNYEKMSDDGEPGGTAGLPMLALLKKKELTNILGVIVRYFGGIKLGANGLVRAYVSSLNESLIDNITEIIHGYHVIIQFDYSKEKEINYILKNTIINNKKYEDNITYDIDIDQVTLDKLKGLSIEIIKKSKKNIKASS